MCFHVRWVSLLINKNTNGVCLQEMAMLTESFHVLNSIQLDEQTKEKKLKKITVQKLASMYKNHQLMYNYVEAL